MTATEQRLVNMGCSLADLCDRQEAEIARLKGQLNPGGDMPTLGKLRAALNCDFAQQEGDEGKRLCARCGSPLRYHAPKGRSLKDAGFITRTHPAWQAIMTLLPASEPDEDKTPAEAWLASPKGQQCRLWADDGEPSRAVTAAFNAGRASIDADTLVAAFKLAGWTAHYESDAKALANTLRELDL